ncbi:hypothetical protein Nepgr_025336 [Nepenthes gracilis]|uniref:Uncharacterized protein n=1 Tax=Nepenthes gracilis TaxID=150966 RepID=A0AAD3T4J7_NEPGR|nr:hypothetical protein Nepgr_025336 [Nepenthes gracilis]
MPRKAYALTEQEDQKDDGVITCNANSFAPLAGCDPAIGSAVALESSVPLDPGDAVVQQAPTKARKAAVSTVLSSSRKMNLVEREDKGCCHEPARKVELVSALLRLHQMIEVVYCQIWMLKTVSISCCKQLNL